MLSPNPNPGAKLAPFNSGGVCQNCPAKTDGALHAAIFFFLPLFSIFSIFLEKIVFRTLEKRVEIIFPDINQLNKGSEIFLRTNSCLKHV
jgi:hypothetical protein